MNGLLLYPLQIVITANKQVRTVQKSQKGVLQNYSGWEKIGKYASLHGVAATYKDQDLKDSTVQDWKNLYEKEYCKKHEKSKASAKVDEDVTVEEIKNTT